MKRAFMYEVYGKLGMLSVVWGCVSVEMLKWNLHTATQCCRRQVSLSGLSSLFHYFILTPYSTLKKLLYAFLDVTLS
jgi:predicted phosphatase